MRPSRASQRTAFAPHNLPPLIEEDAAPSWKKTEGSPQQLPPPPPPPPPPPRPIMDKEQGPTALELAKAEAELARMEEELAKAKLESPVQTQRKTALPDDSDSDSSSSDDDLCPHQQWSSAHGRGSSRRSSVQYLSTKERRAVRRLSHILGDGGEARRAQERRDSLVKIREHERIEAERRRLSDRRRRMQSIAKLIDLSLVWHWLERVEELEETDESDDDQQPESIEEERRLDSEAVAIVENIAISGNMATAICTELGLIFSNGALRTPVGAALNRLAHIKTLKPTIVSYDISNGMYHIQCTLTSPVVCLLAKRSWRDFHRLKRGLEERGVPRKLLPKLPRPRVFSEAKKVFRNVLAPSKKRGDRKWQLSKLRELRTWLEVVVALIDANNATPQALSGIAHSPAQEYIEDFLLKYGQVLTSSA